MIVRKILTSTNIRIMYKLFTVTMLWYALLYSNDRKRITNHSNPKERQCQRMLRLHTIALISHASKVMLKILQARLHQYITKNVQMFKLDLEMAEKSEIKLPTFGGSSKKQESSRKTSTSALFTMPKPLTVWITTNCDRLYFSGLQNHYGWWLQPWN